MKFKLFLAGILLSVLPALNSCNGSGGAKRAGGDTEVTELRCRDLDDPEGVDRAVFSWQIESEADSIVQTAWEIEIASDEKALKNGKADVWSSGKQLSDQQLNVRPQGADLKPGERYWWRVRIWDGADRPTSIPHRSRWVPQPTNGKRNGLPPNGRKAVRYPISAPFSTRINRVRNRYAP